MFFDGQPYANNRTIRRGYRRRLLHRSAYSDMTGARRRALRMAAMRSGARSARWDLFVEFLGECFGVGRFVLSQVSESRPGATGFFAAGLRLDFGILGIFFTVESYAIPPMPQIARHGWGTRNFVLDYQERIIGLPFRDQQRYYETLRHRFRSTGPTANSLSL